MKLRQLLIVAQFITNWGERKSFKRYFGIISQILVESQTIRSLQSTLMTKNHDCECVFEKHNEHTYISLNDDVKRSKKILYLSSSSPRIRIT